MGFQGKEIVLNSMISSVLHSQNCQLTDLPQRIIRPTIVLTDAVSYI